MYQLLELSAFITCNSYWVMSRTSWQFIFHCYKVSPLVSANGHFNVHLYIAVAIETDSFLRLNEFLAYTLTGWLHTSPASFIHHANRRFPKRIGQNSTTFQHIRKTTVTFTHITPSAKHTGNPHFRTCRFYWMGFMCSIVFRKPISIGLY